MTIMHQMGSYEVEFSKPREAFNSLPEDCWFLTDQNVFTLYGSYLDTERTLVLPPGETTKEMAFFEQCLEWLALGGANRQSRLVALGGGVIGDLGGFVAACYMRGIPFIQIPTTVIAQVDSSVGGKVGIDLAAGKNLAGAFYAPCKVYICPEFLDTLDQRQFRNGLAEVLKYGFIANQELLTELDRLGTHPSGLELESIVRGCIEIKAEIVQADEFERKGIRAKLNFGHTVGHAIENATNYREYLHGEAISIGMVAEAKLGEQLGISEHGVTQEVRQRLESRCLPVELPAAIDLNALINAMGRDKKRSGKGLAFSLLTHIGGCKLVQDVAAEAVEQALKGL
jgi:3-dehydroquinate synthase